MTQSLKVREALDLLRAGDASLLGPIGVAEWWEVTCQKNNESLGFIYTKTMQHLLETDAVELYDDGRAARLIKGAVFGGGGGNCARN